MDPEKKKEFIRSGLIAAFFLVIAFVMLNIMIGSAMDPLPPRR